MPISFTMCVLCVMSICTLHIRWQASSIFLNNLLLTQHPPTRPWPVVSLLWMIHTMYCVACPYSSSLLVISSSLPSWGGGGLACTVCGLPATSCAPSLWSMMLHQSCCLQLLPFHHCCPLHYPDMWNIQPPQLSSITLLLPFICQQ